MKRLTAKTKTAYFRRSYEAIDGLWFMKLEEASGFERALDYDQQVWCIMPKIQARLLRDALEITEPGLQGLGEALTAKFSIEGFSCSMAIDNEGRMIFEIKNCPWYDLMKKTGREHLASRVGEVICPNEYAAWASEFDKNIRVRINSRLCDGRKSCTLHFFYDTD